MTNNNTEKVWDVKDMAFSSLAYKDIAILISDDLRLVSALQDLISVEDADAVGKAIIDIGEVMGRGSLIVRKMTEGEFERNSSVNTIFRLQSLASRTLSHYVKKVGSVYLSIVLGELLQKLLQTDLAFPLEIDPLKLTPELLKNRTPEETIEANTNELIRVSQLIFDRITQPSIVSAMPRTLRMTCSFISSICMKNQEKYSQDDQSKLIGGFIMLRFFNPAIITPESYGILPPGIVPSQNQRRNLTLITKTLQNLSNGVLFGQKEQFMEKLNPFLEKNKIDLKNYFNLLSIDPLEHDEVRAWPELELSKFKKLNFPPTFEPFDLNSFVILHRTFLQYRDKLIEKVNQLPPPTFQTNPEVTIDKVFKHLGSNPRSNPGKKQQNLVVGQAISLSFDARIGPSFIDAFQIQSLPLFSTYNFFYSGTSNYISNNNNNNNNHYHLNNTNSINFSNSNFNSSSNNTSSEITTFYLIIRNIKFEWFAFQSQLSAYLQAEFSNSLKKRKKGSFFGNFRGRSVLKSVGNGNLEIDNSGNVHSANFGDNLDINDLDINDLELSWELVVDMSWVDIPDEYIPKCVACVRGLLKDLCTSCSPKSLKRICIVHPNSLYFVLMSFLNPLFKTFSLHKIPIEEIYDCKDLAETIPKLMLPSESKTYFPGCQVVEKIPIKNAANDKKKGKNRLLKLARHSLLEIDPKTSILKKKWKLLSIDCISATPNGVYFTFDIHSSKSSENSSFYRMEISDQVEKFVTSIIQARLTITLQLATGRSTSLSDEYSIAKEKFAVLNSQKSIKVLSDCVLCINNRVIKSVVSLLPVNDVQVSGNAIVMKFQGRYDKKSVSDQKLAVQDENSAQVLARSILKSCLKETESIDSRTRIIRAKAFSASFLGIFFAFFFGRRWRKITRARRNNTLQEKDLFQFRSTVTTQQDNLRKSLASQKQQMVVVADSSSEGYSDGDSDGNDDDLNKNNTSGITITLHET